MSENFFGEFDISEGQSRAFLIFLNENRHIATCKQNTKTMNRQQ